MLTLSLYSYSMQSNRIFVYAHCNVHVQLKECRRRNIIYNRLCTDSVEVLESTGFNKSPVVPTFSAWLPNKAQLTLVVLVYLIDWFPPEGGFGRKCRPLFLLCPERMWPLHTLWLTPVDQPLLFAAMTWLHVSDHSSSAQQQTCSE